MDSSRLNNLGGQAQMSLQAGLTLAYVDFVNKNLSRVNICRSFTNILA